MNWKKGNTYCPFTGGALAKAALAAGFSIETFSGHKDKSTVPPRATDLNSWESNAFKI